MNEGRIIVAHPYKQHSFALAEGLRRAGMLKKYVTTVYYKKYNLTYIITKILGKKDQSKAKTRCNAELNNYVMQKAEFLGLIKLLIIRSKWLKKYYNSFKYYSSDIFAKKVAKYCLKNAVNIDAIVVYDDTSFLLSKILKENNSNIKIVLDMSAPSLPFLSDIYKKDMIISPKYAEQLRAERQNSLDEKLLERSYNEIKYADYYIVASEFTKKSLEYCNVKSNRIFICRYGVDFDCFKEKYVKTKEKINVIYIGGTKEYKGIAYLLEAYTKLKDKIKLTIAGDNTLPKEKLKEYNEIVFTGNILHKDVATILSQNDLMIFPSIGDGFGLSVLEALASGLPVICSENAGAADIIQNGINGFVIKSQSSD